MIDPALPLFESAWDADPDVIAEALPPVEGWSIRSVSLEKIRHRLGERGIVQYRVAVASDTAEAEWWVTAVAHSVDRSDGIVAKARRRDIEPPPGLSVVAGVHRRLRMAFTAFPMDPKLPGLMALASGEPVDGESLAHMRPVRHRAGLGATLLSGDRYLKCHPTGGGRRVLERGRAVEACLPASLIGAIPRRPAGPDDITVTDIVAGTGLDRSADVASCRIAGRALAELHSVDSDELGSCDEVPLARAVRGASWISLVLPEAIPLLAGLGERTALLSTGRSLVHGDMKPDHVLIADDGVGLVDLDSAGRGRPLSDIASLVCRLGDVQLATAVLDGYAEGRPGVSWDGFEGEFALASIKHALFHAQHRRPGWQEAVFGVLESEIAQSIAQSRG